MFAEIAVDEFINSLPEGHLRELTKLFNDGYQLKEIARRLKLS